jgi:ParB-like chromosome segregation protein Spo0J
MSRPEMLFLSLDTVFWRDEDNPRIDDRLEARKRELLGSDPDGWPPIVVVVYGDRYLGIDGWARWNVAGDLGLATIAARIEPMPADFRQRAFELNQHGFPLSLAQRRAHALYLKERYPERSDRDIARACGLSPTTIGRLRDDEQSRDRNGGLPPLALFLRRIAYPSVEWGDPGDAAAELRATFDDDELASLGEELGLTALSVLDIAEELGFDSEANPGEAI